jgi:hypothetical protein
MPTASLSILILVSPFFELTIAAATCYTIEGTAITDQPALQPCNLVAGTQSMCCGTNSTTNIIDTCLPNGLCVNYAHGETFYWRDSCTDPTWQSPYCLKLCMAANDNAGPGNHYNAHMLPCPDGSWCCAQDISASQCCEAKQGVMLPATIGVFSTSAPASSATIAEPSTTASTSLPSTSTSQADSGLTSSAKVGLGIGLSIGGVLAAAAIAWLVMKRRQLRRMPTESHDPAKAPTREPGLYDVRRDGNHPNGSVGQYELVRGGMARRWELQ